MNNMFEKYLSLADSLLVTAICMGIVFVVLMIVAYILSLFKHIPKDTTNTQVKKEILEKPKNNIAKNSKESIKAVFNPNEITDENMIVAMLVASMEAAENNDGAYIKIRNIREI